MDRNEGTKDDGSANTGNAFEDEKRDIARHGGQPTSYGEGNQGKMGQDDQSGGDGDQSGNSGGGMSQGQDSSQGESNR